MYVFDAYCFCRNSQMLLCSMMAVGDDNDGNDDGRQRGIYVKRVQHTIEKY